MYFKVDHTEISRKRSDAHSTSDMILCVFARLPNFHWLTRFKSTWEIMNAYPGNETICLRKLRSIKIKIVLTQRRWLVVYIYRAAKNSFMKNSEIILNTYKDSLTLLFILYLRMFFWPRLNILIFLSILTWKYPWVFLNFIISLWHSRFAV